MGQMIKFEHNTLVLNNVFSKQDVAEIDRFAEYVRNQENERIIKLLEDQQIRFISNGFWTEGVAVRASIALIKESK